MITKNDKIADIIKRYPFMKQRMIDRNKMFANLNNPLIFNSVGKIARIKDIAAMSGEDLENLLSYINEEIEKMKELHIHDVLRMMIETQKTYDGKADFVQDIKEKFGEDVRFHACSDGGMDADAAYDFLIRRGKISINPQQNVGIDPNMTMCDENAPHDHHHDHDH